MASSRGIWLAPRSQVVVCERRPYWIALLQRHLLQEECQARSCMSPVNLVGRLDAAISQVVWLHADGLVAETLNWLARSRQERGDLPVIVSTFGECCDLECLLRELGAAEFVVEPESGEMAALRVRRRLQLLTDSGADATSIFLSPVD